MSVLRTACRPDREGLSLLRGADSGKHRPPVPPPSPLHPLRRDSVRRRHAGRPPYSAVSPFRRAGDFAGVGETGNAAQPRRVRLDSRRCGAGRSLDIPRHGAPPRHGASQPAAWPGPLRRIRHRLCGISPTGPRWRRIRFAYRTSLDKTCSHGHRRIVRSDGNVVELESDVTNRSLRTASVSATMQG